MYNIFRIAGDLFHVISILLLLLRLRVAKQAVGISIKTQELYLVVFVFRYLDLFTTYYSLYNTVMKILYISSTAYIIYMFAVGPCAVLAIITILFQQFDLLEMFWYFSIYLEALAIIPQLIVLQRYREVENLTGHYVFFLGGYRALYILNWIYRAYHERYYKHNFVVYAAAIIQTCLYIDFFYYYILSKYKGGKFALPQ